MIRRLLSLGLLFLPVHVIISQTLDTDFGSNGKTIVSFDSGYDEYAAVAIQPDGKILACGNYGNPEGAYHNAVIVRYNQDGTEDVSFGVNGRLYSGVMQIARPDAIALQPDGKILIAGCKSNGASFDTFNFLVARYNADGTPDASFDEDGILEIDMNGFGDIAYAVALQSDGKVIVAGSAASTTIDDLDEDFAIVRLFPNGTPDSSFGVNGKTIVPFAQSIDVPNFIELQDDGKILIAGTSGGNESGSDFAIARLNTDGNLDDSFGTAGKITTHFGTVDNVYSFRFVSGGFIAGGLTHEYSNPGLGLPATYRGVIVKYNADGSVDENFGDAGSVVFPSSFPNVRDISGILEVDGKYMCSSYIRDGAVFYLVIIRFNDDGSLDTTLDDDGIATVDLGVPLGRLNAMEIGPDNKIVGVGGIGTPVDSFVVRFDSSGLNVGSVPGNVFSVYPNPFTAQLTIHGLAASVELSLKVFDLSGRQIAAIQQRDNTFFMPETLASGVYVIEVSNGIQTIKHKVVKR